MFKIGNSKELPTIPDHLSEEGKDFVRQCLQRDPSNRPTAVQLLGHPFVRSAAPAPRPASGSEPSEPPSAAPTKSGGQVQGSSLADVQSLTIQRPKSSKPTSPSSGCQMRNMSCPVSPRAVSGSSTPRRLPTAAPPHPAWTRK